MGGGHLVVYYVTEGLPDVDAPSVAGYESLAVSLGSMGLGFVIMFAGLVLTLAGHRRQQAGGR